jgi:hypothetical protein
MGEREEIVTSFISSNTVALRSYASLGFRPAGEIEDDEPFIVLDFAHR